MARLAEQHSLGAYATLLPEIESLSVEYARLALARLGWTWREGERVTADDLAGGSGCANGYRRLLGRLLEMLGEEGYTRRDGAEWEVVQAAPAPVGGWPWRAASSGLAPGHPDCKVQLTLFERCAADLAGALHGDRDPLDLLFPGDHSRSRRA